MPVSPSTTCTWCGLEQPYDGPDEGLLVTFTCTGCGAGGRDLVHEPVRRAT